MDYNVSNKHIQKNIGNEPSEQNTKEQDVKTSNIGKENINPSIFSDENPLSLEKDISIKDPSSSSSFKLEDYLEMEDVNLNPIQLKTDQNIIEKTHNRNLKIEEKFTEHQIKQLENAKNDVEVLEIFGSIVGKIIESIQPSGNEKELNADELLKQKPWEKILKKIHMAAPYLKAFDTLLPIIAFSKVQKTINQCEETIRQLEKELQSNPNPKSIQIKIEEAKILLSSLKLERAKIGLGEHGLGKIGKENVEFALKQLLPIIPNAKEIFENVEWGLEEFSSLSKICLSTTSVIEKGRTLDALLNLKAILKMKKLELSQSKNLEKTEIEELNKLNEKIEKLEKEIFTAGVNFTKDGVSLVKELYVGLEKFLPRDISFSEHLLPILNIAGEVVNINEKTEKIKNANKKIKSLKSEVSRLNTKIEDLEKFNRLIEKEIQKTPSVKSNALLKEKIANETIINILKSRKDAIQFALIPRQHLEITDILLGLASSSLKIQGNALSISGIDSILNGDVLGTGVEIAKYVMIGSKALLYKKSDLKKAFEEFKLNKFYKNKTEKEIKNKKNRLELLNLNVFKNLDKMEISKGQSMPNISKREIFAEVNKEISILVKESNVLNKKIDQKEKALLKEPTNKKISQEIESLKNQIKSVSHKISLNLQFMDLTQDLEISATQNVDLALFKMSFLNAIQKPWIEETLKKEESLRLKKETIEKDYKLGTKLEAIGISSEEYMGMTEDLKNIIENKQCSRRFSEYFEKTSPKIHSSVFDPKNTIEEQAKLIVNYAIAEDLS